MCFSVVCSVEHLVEISWCRNYEPAFFQLSRHEDLLANKLEVALKFISLTRFVKAVNNYCASFCLVRISGAENKLSRGWVGGWLGIAKIKPTQPQLGLAGAWAELGNICVSVCHTFKIGQKSEILTVHML